MPLMQHVLALQAKDIVWGLIIQAYQHQRQVAALQNNTKAYDSQYLPRKTLLITVLYQLPFFPCLFILSPGCLLSKQDWGIACVKWLQSTGNPVTGLYCYCIEQVP